MNSLSSVLDKNVTKRYLSLPQPCNQVQVEYVWIDGSGERLRCKSRTMDAVPTRATDCAVWTFDGWRTGQAEGAANADVLLYPCALFNDPFRRGQNKIVLCETYNANKKPTATNFRSSCRKLMDQVREGRLWFGMEQQFILFGSDGRPLGCPRNSFAGEADDYSEALFYVARIDACYCGVGANTADGRDILESLYRACMYAGVKVAGGNAELIPSQWEFQVGPCEGVEIGDHLWMGRFLLHRIAEDYGVVVSFAPKPLPTGNWEGQKLHTNFSTLRTRQDGGLRELEKTIEKLRQNQSKHLQAYSTSAKTDPSSTERRPSSAGNPSTPSHACGPVNAAAGGSSSVSHPDFTHGVANREASVRIPRLVADEGKGHLQDRRPPSNADPYRIAECFARTECTCADNNNPSFVKVDSSFQASLI